MDSSNSLVRARRARGWSQARLVAGIEEYARRHGMEIASTASLHVYVSDWENDKPRPVPDSLAQILRALLGLTDAELFPAKAVTDGSRVDGYDELVTRIEASRALGAGMADTLLQQTELLRTMDRQVGAANLVDQMQAHLGAIQDALTFAVLPASRRPLALALTGAATLAAWQALDVGAADRAWRHYELGKSAARDAEAPAYLAHAMAEQAYVLAEAGKADLAVQLVEEARRTAGTRVSRRLTSWLHAAHAELCALAGQADDSRRALDDAAAALPAGDESRTPDVASIFLNDGHLGRWRANTLVLLGETEAVGDLRAALDVMDPTFTRAEAGLRCHLAQAHLIRGEYDEAAAQLRTARLVASRTGSVRHRRRIDRLTLAAS